MKSAHRQRLFRRFLTNSHPACCLQLKIISTKEMPLERSTQHTRGVENPPSPPNFSCGWWSMEHHSFLSNPPHERCSSVGTLPSSSRSRFSTLAFNHSQPITEHPLIRGKQKKMIPNNLLSVYHFLPCLKAVNFYFSPGGVRPIETKVSLLGVCGISPGIVWRATHVPT